MCVGTSSEFYKPTKDTINPAYHAITDDKSKNLMEKPTGYYEEVKKSLNVETARNPAYYEQ